MMALLLHSFNAISPKYLMSHSPFSVSLSWLCAEIKHLCYHKRRLDWIYDVYIRGVNKDIKVFLASLHSLSE